MHRYLHDNRFLYKLLHKPHHIYNNNLTPFAGLAFHPIDGMLQVRGGRGEREGEGSSRSGVFGCTPLRDACSLPSPPNISGRRLSPSRQPRTACYRAPSCLHPPPPPRLRPAY